MAPSGMVGCSFGSCQRCCNIWSEVGLFVGHSSHMDEISFIYFYEIFCPSDTSLQRRHTQKCQWDFFQFLVIKEFLTFSLWNFINNEINKIQINFPSFFSSSSFYMERMSHGFKGLINHTSNICGACIISADISIPVNYL